MQTEESKHTDSCNSLNKKHPLLDYDSDQKAFQITAASKEILSLLEEECYIISISGGMITGKSFLLNLIASFLSQLESIGNDLIYKNIFKVGDGDRRTTDGLDFFCLKLRDKNIILLDFEGDNDPHRQELSSWIYNNFMSVTLSSSHIHVHNYKDAVQLSFLERLKSIATIINQTNLRESQSFELCLTKRDHARARTQEELAEAGNRLLQVIEAQSNLGEIAQTSLHVFPNIPEHFLRAEDEGSCIKNGMICQSCREHLFTQTVKEFTMHLYQKLERMTPYRNGKEMLELIENFIECNKINLPIKESTSSIKTLRDNKYKETQSQILSEFSEIKCPGEGNNALQRLLQSFFENQPDEQNFSFNKLFKLSLERSRCMFLLKRIQNFIEDDISKIYFTVLDDNEQQLILDIFIIPLEKSLQELSEECGNYAKYLKTVNKKYSTEREKSWWTLLQKIRDVVKSTNCSTDDQFLQKLFQIIPKDEILRMSQEIFTISPERAANYFLYSSYFIKVILGIYRYYRDNFSSIKNGKEKEVLVTTGKLLGKHQENLESVVSLTLQDYLERLSFLLKESLELRKKRNVIEEYDIRTKKKMLGI